MKRSFKIRTHINPSIKVGDKVRLIDGSGLTCDLLEDTDIWIISPLKELGIEQRLNSLVFTVVETDIKDCACNSALVDILRLQDIVVKSDNGVKFRTCSNFVTLIK